MLSFRSSSFPLSLIHSHSLSTSSCSSSSSYFLLSSNFPLISSLILCSHRNSNSSPSFSSLFSTTTSPFPSLLCPKLFSPFLYTSPSSHSYSSSYSSSSQYSYSYSIAPISPSFFSSPFGYSPSHSRLSSCDGKQSPFPIPPHFSTATSPSPSKWKIPNQQKDNNHMSNTNSTSINNNNAFSTTTTTNTQHQDKDKDEDENKIKDDESFSTSSTSFSPSLNSDPHVSSLSRSIPNTLFFLPTSPEKGKYPSFTQGILHCCRETIFFALSGAIGFVSCMFTPYFLSFVSHGNDDKVYEFMNDHLGNMGINSMDSFVQIALSSQGIMSTVTLISFWGFHSLWKKYHSKKDPSIVEISSPSPFFFNPLNSPSLPSLSFLGSKSESKFIKYLSFLSPMVISVFLFLGLQIVNDVLSESPTMEEPFLVTGCKSHRQSFFIFPLIVFWAPLSEETLLRGLLFARLCHFVGLGPSVAISSVIFGLLHVSEDSRKVISSALAAVPFAYLYYSYKNILFPMAAHLGLNLFSFLMLNSDSPYKTLQSEYGTTKKTSASPSPSSSLGFSDRYPDSEMSKSLSQIDDAMTDLKLFINNPMEKDQKVLDSIDEDYKIILKHFNGNDPNTSPYLLRHHLLYLQCITPENLNDYSSILAAISMDFNEKSIPQFSNKEMGKKVGKWVEEVKIRYGIATGEEGESVKGMNEFIRSMELKSTNPNPNHQTSPLWSVLNWFGRRNPTPLSPSPSPSPTIYDNFVFSPPPHFSSSFPIFKDFDSDGKLHSQFDKSQSIQRFAFYQRALNTAAKYYPYPSTSLSSPSDQDKYLQWLSSPSSLCFAHYVLWYDIVSHKLERQLDEKISYWNKIKIHQEKKGNERNRRIVPYYEKGIMPPKSDGNPSSSFLSAWTPRDPDQFPRLNDKIPVEFLYHFLYRMRATDADGYQKMKVLLQNGKNPMELIPIKKEKEKED